MHARQVRYHWTYPSLPVPPRPLNFLLWWGFSSCRGCPRNCPVAQANFELKLYQLSASRISGITGLCHHTQSFTILKVSLSSRGGSAGEGSVLTTWVWSPWPTWRRELPPTGCSLMLICTLWHKCAPSQDKCNKIFSFLPLFLVNLFFLFCFAFLKYILFTVCKHTSTCMHTWEHVFVCV